MDYQQLCLEVFGTDDEQELREIGAKYRAKNPRNAGRKKKFADYEIKKMQELQQKGVTLNEIAELYGTSRQQIERSLAMPFHPGCTLRMTYMHKTRPCTVIDVDFMNRNIFIQNKTDDLLYRAFGVLEKPTWEDFEIFLKDRCFSESRGDIKKILERVSMYAYDPLEIQEQYKGRFAEDNMWIRFSYKERTAE